MRLPTFTLQGIGLPRVIFSIRPSPSSPVEEILALMKNAYQMGIACFDLPSANHLESFRALRKLTEDADLLGFRTSTWRKGSLFWEASSSFRREHCLNPEEEPLPSRADPPFEGRRRLEQQALLPSHSVFRGLHSEEIDRLALDPSRFEKALAVFHPSESPFLFLGGKYADWISGLGRIDLLSKMALKVKEKGFTPSLRLLGEFHSSKSEVDRCGRLCCSDQSQWEPL